MTPILHPAALEELLRAGRYYAKISATVARKFREEVDVALDHIGRDPERWPIVRNGFRKCVLKKYRYTIIYDSEADSVRVYAVAHHKRKPEYWSRRKFN